MPRPKPSDSPKTILKASEYHADFSEFLKGYEYQPDLTGRLDDLEKAGFTQELINEIVLWKVNRYVSLESDLLAQAECLKSLKPGEHRKAATVLTGLLKVHGVDLPMASTILRFRNPSVFQIIDRHAYRAVYGSGFPLYTTSPDAKKLSVYFKYLDDLHALCTAKGLAFKTVDRVLYIFDKRKNGKL
jgi:hypothetical protein